MKAVEPIRDLKKIRAMRTVLRDQSLRNELLFMLGINAGLRVSDILSLRVADLVKENGKARKDLMITEKKTGKTKRFYFGDTVQKVIEAYQKEYRPSLQDVVFKSRKGDNRPISREQAWHILNTAAEHVGLVERDGSGKLVSGAIGTHTLRKTFGYHAYRAGTDLALLMDIFNHSSERVTLRYIGITEQQKKEIYLNLNLG